MNKTHICDIIHKIGENLCPGRYEKVESISEPFTTKILSTETIRTIVKELNPKYWQPIDKIYREVSMESMKNFLKIDEISERPYEKEKHDCDNFALELAGHVSEWAGNPPFGIVYLNDHAINCFVCENKLYFVEPQNDKIYTALGKNKTVNCIIL